MSSLTLTNSPSKYISHLFEYFIKIAIPSNYNKQYKAY